MHDTHIPRFTSSDYGSAVSLLFPPTKKSNPPALVGGDSNCPFPDALFTFCKISRRQAAVSAAPVLSVKSDNILY
jgi:hypothetical protein